MSDELKPCPFCGGEAAVSIHYDEDIWSHNSVEWTRVRCSGFGDDAEGSPCPEPAVSWPTHATNERGVTLAIAAWNRRTSAPEQPTPPITPDADTAAIRHHERFGPLDEHGNPLDPRRRG